MLTSTAMPWVLLKRRIAQGCLCLTPNGDVDRTVHYGLFLLYPKVKPAGTIHIAVRPDKEKKNERDVEPLDMNQVVATLAATMSSFATMYMLITR